jgi:predicted permease
MTNFWRDLTHGARALRKDPGFAAAAIFTLALGIGANSTVFSWINSTLLNPIPGASDPASLVAVSRGRSGSFSYPDYLDLRTRTHSFSGLAAAQLCPVGITGRERPERVWGMLVSENYFDVLGVKPALGRGFLPSENVDGAEPFVVISYRLWQERFSGSAGVLGKTLPINSHDYTIVGVAPAIFQGSSTGLRTELWFPLVMTDQLAADLSGRLNRRKDSWLVLQGRLRHGVSREQAQSETLGLFQQIAREYPDSHKGATVVNLYPLWRAPNGANSIFSSLLPLLFALAGVVLLLACANLANLVLARGIARRREMAIRLSLGASRGRLVRQLLAESVVLALCGGALALAATLWTSGSLMQFAPTSNLPIWLSIPVDHRVFAVTLLFSLLSTFLFAGLPALRASRMDPVSAMKDESAAGGRTRSRLASALAAAQVAFSLLLLICASLLVRSFQASHSFDPGFNPRNVLVESWDLFPAGYSEAQGNAFNRQAIDKVRALPGVQSAALADWVPLGFNSNADSFEPEGYAAGPRESIEAGVAHVSPGYFATTEIPLVAGRDFLFQNSGNQATEVIVNEALAARYWPGQQAVGKRMRVEGKWATVAGVVRTSHYYDLDEPPKPFLYLPLEQFYYADLTLHVRVNGDPLGWAASVTECIHQLNASLPIFDVGTLEARISAVTFPLRMAGAFSAAFGLLALALATLGIYGMVAYSTQQRTREMGIRMALGARPGQLVRLVIRQCVWMVAGGAAAGLAASFGATRLLGRFLLGVTATDPLTYFGVTSLLLAVALAACYLPARRAAAGDPIAALRAE